VNISINKPQVSEGKHYFGQGCERAWLVPFKVSVFQDIDTIHKAEKKARDFISEEFKVPLDQLLAITASDLNYRTILVWIPEKTTQAQ